MSNKRGKRGKSNKFSVQLVIRNAEQLQRTLDLRGVKDERPSINEVVERVVERLEREREAEMLAMARSWKKGGKGWPSCMMYECMGEDYPGWDDEEGFDPYEEIFDGLAHKGSRKLKELNKKLFKRSSKHKKHRGSEEDDYWANRHTMFRNGEWSDDLDDEDNYEDPYKCIKFYSDINNEMSVREFYSLKEFNDFCTENNYIIGTTDYNNLVNLQVVHCCLDPISLEYGENDVITDNSYGALYWSVSEDSANNEGSSVDANARTFTD